MKNEKINSNMEDTFPKTLGLAALDKRSIKKEKDSFSAEYLWGKDLLYHVSINELSCTVVEYFDGEIVGTTTGFKKLEEAFFHHLMSQPPYKSKQFERIYHQIIDKRNVNVRFASQSSFFYFPAGYLFALRQPVGKDNRSAFVQFEKELLASKETDLKIESKKEGIILKMMRDASVSKENVMVVNFSSTLFNLVSSVELLWTKGLVPRLREYRLNVLDSSESAIEDMTIYYGDPARNFVTYSLAITEGTGVSLDKVQKNFKKASIKFLQNQSK